MTVNRSSQPNRVTRVRIDAVGTTKEDVFAAIDGAAELLAPLGTLTFKKSRVTTTTEPNKPVRGWKTFDLPAPRRSR
jgi:hypothetical protein